MKYGILGIVLGVAVALFFFNLFFSGGSRGISVRTHERSRCRSSLQTRGKKRIFWILIMIAAIVAVRVIFGFGVSNVVINML